MNEVLQIILWTLTPLVELRWAILHGLLFTKLSWLKIFIIAVVTNAVLGPIIFVILDKFIHLFLRIKLFEKWWNKYIERIQKKTRKYVEKYGLLGLSIFISIPLPGSGSYSGAVAAHIFNINIKKFIIANTIGVLIAGILVTIAGVTGIEIIKIIFMLG